MKRGKSRLLSGLLSMSMAFSVISVPIEAFAATDTSGHWAEASINRWINSGFINGYPDGTFRPNNAISRAEFVTIANKAFGFTRSQGISFDDVKPGYWAYGEIQKGVAAGYIQGDSNGKFRPGSAVTRQEAAVMLSNLKRYNNDEAGAYNYTDRGDMASWAVGAIGAVSRNGIMSGYPNGTFRPQQSLTRAEAVAALQKVAGSFNSFTSTNTTNYTPPNYVTTNTNSGLSSNSSTSTKKASNDNDYGFNGIVLEDTRMENRNLTKDLLIPRSLGSKNITLKNVRLKGTLYVEGGSNITLENCNIANVVMNRANAVLKNNGSSDIEEVRFEEKGRLDGKGYGTVLIDDNSISEIILDADIDTLILDAEVDVKLYANSNIDTFEVTKNADNAKIKIGEDAQVSDMQIYDKVRISGKGKIDVMTVYVSNVRSEIEPRRLIQQDNARKPNFNYKDDDDDDDDYDNLTLDSDDENFDGEDDKFNRVRISAEDVTAKNFTVYDDLIITSSAGDSTIELEDVTVRGNVYVEGGGDSSVIFDDCSISGNIYSRKSTSGRYDEAVAIKLNNTPVRGDVYVTGDTILESDKKLRKVVLNKALSKTFRMNADANSLIINYNNTVQIRGNHTIDTAEVAAGLNDVSITMDGGKIGTFTVRSPIRMDGTGTIDKLVTGEANDISSNITIGTTEKIDGSGTTPSGSYTITASVQGENGSISPNGQQSVTKGANKEFVITANSGYHVAAIVVDNTEVNLNNNLYQKYTYTFNNVTANHNIIVSFAEGAGTNGEGNGNNGTPGGDKPSEGDYTIAVTVNGTGGYADNMMIPVKDGEDASVKFTAEKDYHVSKIVIDAGTESEQNLKKISDSTVTFSEVTYTFKNVTKSHTISVEFAEGQGTNVIGISSIDDDSAILKPSGYKYDITTELFNAETGIPLEKNEDGRYYCIAGDRITLAMLKFDTDDPNKEYLKTRWAVVNSTTGMEMELYQTEGKNTATLQTTKGSGYAAILKVQVYDTNKETTVPVASSDIAELHVDVPLEELRLDSLNCQNNQFSLSPQNIICIPSNASIASDKQSILWEVIDTNIEPVSSPLIPAGEPVAKIVDISNGNNGTFPCLRVEQYYKETELSEDIDLLTQPMGTVKLQATIPNGAGNKIDKVQQFTINFIGNTIIPVEAIKLNGTDKETPKKLYGIEQLDLSKITVTLVPRKPTYQTVEWQIETETDYLTGETTTITQDNPSKLGTIKTKKVNGEDREVIFESTGYPGKVVLRPYIKHGKGADGDFISENPDERIIVKIATTEPVVTANTITSTNGTDEDDKITLSAKITNGDKTPYTEIKGWRKTYKENPQENDWQEVEDITLSKSDDGTYTAEYTVKKEDLNTNSAYDSNIVYFQAYTNYDMTDSAIEQVQEERKIVYSNVVSVDCHAQSISLPNETGYKQKIIVDKNNTCTIKGYDTVTLSSALDNGTSIDWDIEPKEDSIATLKDNVLTVKGQPDKSFQLIAKVANKGAINFTINTAFEKVEVGKSRIVVRDSKNTNIETPIKTGTTIYFHQLEVNPKYATYNNESINIKDKLSWRVRNGDEIADVDANENGIGEYTVPDDATGKLSITALWQNAGDDGSAATSNPFEVQIVDNFVEVTGIDFADTGLEPTPGQGEDKNKYTYTIPKVDKDIDFNLGSARILPANATANLTQNRVQWTSTPGSSIDAEIATLNNNVLKVPGYTTGGTVTLTARVADGLGEKQDYVATLTLTSPHGTGQKPVTPGTGDTTGSGTSSASEEANTFDLPQPSEDNTDEFNSINDVVSNENNTENNKDTVENESNKNDVPQEDNKEQDNTNEIVIPFTAVSDINFDDINDLQKLPSNEYTITSNRTKQITLRLADSTSTVNGMTKHTGIKVLPTNATNQTVTWSAKNTTLTAIPNVVQVNGIGTLNQNSNIFIIDTNVSGTVTLVATIKNGKTEKDNFVKELVIHVNKPVSDTSNEIKDTTQKQSDESSKTTNSTSSNTTTNNMPSNTTQATKKQVISVGDTSVGTSSVTSASAANTKSNTNVTSAAKNTSSSDVKIEVSGQCKKGISIPLKAVSKSSQREYTDVDWEITDDGGTNARITSGNRLRATSTGTVTITATVYTSSGTMVCSTNISISD